MAAPTNGAELFLCAITDLAEGELRRIELAGHAPYAVCRVQNQVYVVDDTCSHGHASLGDEGELEGFRLTCTWHDGAFDVRTGEVLAMPCTEPIRAHAVTVRDFGVYIVV